MSSLARTMIRPGSTDWPCLPFPWRSVGRHQARGEKAPGKALRPSLPSLSSPAEIRVWLLKRSYSTKTDGVGFEAVSVSPCGSSHLRHGDFGGEAKGEAVCPPALFAGGVAGATADQAERLGSLMEADAIPTDVAELAAVWYRLPDAVRAGIVAMVRASGG